MVGRFAGGALMASVKAETVLAGASLGAGIMMLVATFATGPLACGP
jgi:MFS transporter, FHS family, L-fucose permease